MCFVVKGRVLLCNAQATDVEYMLIVPAGALARRVKDRECEVGFFKFHGR